MIIVGCNQQYEDGSLDPIPAIFNMITYQCYLHPTFGIIIEGLCPNQTNNPNPPNTIRSMAILLLIFIIKTTQQH